MLKKRFFISSAIAISTVGAAGFGYYHYFFHPNNTDVGGPQKDTYYTVGTGDISSDIQVLGETNLLNEQKLKFNIDGTISQIFVTEGQKVKTGDILAELDKGQLKNELKEANITYENAKINLEKITERLSGDDKIKDTSSLETQKRKLELLKKDYETLKSNNIIKIQEKSKEIEKLVLGIEKGNKDFIINQTKLNTDLIDQKRDFDYKKKTLSDEQWNIEKSIKDEERSLETKISDYHKTILDTYEDVNNDIAGFSDTLRNLNEILGIDSDYKSPEGNVYLSAKNILYKNNAENNYWKSKGAVQILEKKYNEKDKDTLTIPYLVELLELKRAVYENLYLAGDFTAKAADNSIESTDFTSSSISSVKSLANSIRSSAYTGKNNITTLVQKLQNLDSPETTKERSRIAIEKLQKSKTDLNVSFQKIERDYQDLVTLLPEKLKELTLAKDKNERDLEQSKRDAIELKYSSDVSEDDKAIEIKNLKQDYEIAQRSFSKKYASIDKNEEIVLARNTLKQAQITIDQVNKKIENYEIRASFNGTVGSLMMKTGDKIANAATTDEKFIYLLNPGIMEIKIKLDQIDVTKITKGMGANVTFDSYPSVVFTGTLGEIDSKPIDENGIKKYQVKMTIDKGDLNIFSGMSANVNIVLEKKENIILVPTMSVEMDNDSGMQYVTKLIGGKKIKQSIEAGIQGNGNTEIMSGVTVGDQILEINFDANSFKPDDFKQPSYTQGAG